MGVNGYSKIPEILRTHHAELLSEWKQAQLGTARKGLIKDAELHEQSAEFLGLLEEATRSGELKDVNSAPWSNVRSFLARLSQKRSAQGFSPIETATFVFSFKSPLFSRLQQEYSRDAAALASETWTATQLLDQLGLLTAESFQKSREEVIGRQREEMLELSTPVIKLWDGVLALPLIGTLDSARSQVVMESLLTRIVETGSPIAIIDITGVPTVDTLTAQHLIKTITAARLMGAECIISGIRPQIAQTIVHLGVDLNSVITKSSLADAFRLALDRLRLQIVPRVESAR